MPQPSDAWGNYVVDVSYNLHQVGVISGGGGASAGSGAPSGSTSGNVYVQNDSTPAGQVWILVNGAWQIFPAGGSAGNGVPNVNTPGNLYIQWDSAPPNQLWEKGSNGVWV